MLVAPLRVLLWMIITAACFIASAHAQDMRVPSRIDTSQRHQITGSRHPDARPENDLGPAAPSLVIDGVTILLKPSPDRQKALDQLLADQQDPASPSFRKWLTPEEYADRFGTSQADLSAISAWLQSAGLQIDQTARGRNSISFHGTAAQLQATFGTQIHRFRAQSEVHFANTTEITVPAALTSSVAAVRGLDDFRMRPSARLRSNLQPDFNTSTGTHYLVPDDVAVIYGLNSLYARGIDGTGQKIVIAGQSALRTDAGSGYPDLDGFRAKYNLPANTPQVIPVGSSPVGVVSGDVEESTLDLEWSGAVAPNATLIFVYAKNVLNAVRYAIDQNLAPIISFSYGDCEQRATTAYQIIAQQANAQGITWIASSGDSGAAACDNQNATVAVATQGVAVSFPASIPEVTGVGGTTFNEGSGNYWDSVNGVNSGSALSYIPETAWNDSPSVGFLDATGGGASIVYPKPVWQTGAGVPGDGARDVPDISFASSPQHDGYQVYSNGAFHVYGGTSVATPLFGGILALLNHSLLASGAIAQPGLGNINPALYRMAASGSSAFHDITSGNNVVPCQTASTNCVGGTFGYTAGPGYDQVTGLGSIDANALISQWIVPAAADSAISISISPNPVYQTTSNSGQAQWTFTVTLSETAGGTTVLTGLNLGGTDYSAQISSFFGTAKILPLGTINATLSVTRVTASQTLTLVFSGVDPGGRTWSQQIPVALVVAAAASPQITGLTNAASFQQVYAPGMIMSVFGTELSGGTQVAAALPLPASMQNASAKINGVVAPLYYVSAGQFNIQIPYETQPGPATLSLTANGQSTTATFTVSANAPGIFAGAGNLLVPNSTGKIGNTLLLFMTGDGSLSPFLSDGATPPSTTPFTQLPKPTASVTVTVAGINAPLAFVGVPNGLTGVTQINFVVPPGVPTGTQNVVVTVGGIASPPVGLRITN